jgi:hypothetical protein
MNKKTNTAPKKNSATKWTRAPDRALPRAAGSVHLAENGSKYTRTQDRKATLNHNG